MFWGMVVQEAIKCMRHSKRSILTTDDVDSALRLRNVEPLYGFASGDPLRFRRALGHSDLFYVEDRDLEFKEIIDAPLPRAPLDTSVVAHWLAVEGVQPAIPENAPIENLAVPPETKRGDAHGGGPRKEDDGAIEVKIPVKHVLSRELQVHTGDIHAELFLVLMKSDLRRSYMLNISSFRRASGMWGQVQLQIFTFPQNVHSLIVWVAALL
jgi:transcription initiation factor TFIID subunit 6